MAKEKPAVGFYDLTGCNGCLLSFLFNEDEVLEMARHFDIKTFRFIKEVKEEKQFDIVFMEGLVASNSDLEVLKEVRAKTKTLVALGACACTGCIPAYRNFIDSSKYVAMVYEKARELKDVQPVPINKHVQVDYYIPGCPPDKKQILEFMKDVLLGKKPNDYDKPVCFECRLNENRCLLDDGKMCLGPMTRGGCNSVCTNGKLECWGCRGPMPDANMAVMSKLLEQKGFTKDQVRQRMRTFFGMMIETPPEPKPIKIKPEKKAKKLKKAAKPAKKKTAKKLKKAAKPAKKAKPKKTAKKIVKKQKKAAKTVVKKTAKKTVKKAMKKTVKKTARKTVKKTAKKAVKKTVQKAVTKKTQPTAKPAQQPAQQPAPEQLKNNSKKSFLSMLKGRFKK
jgi:coenzyme F420-reducing hydrogenase gamma subunit